MRISFYKWCFVAVLSIHAQLVRADTLSLLVDNHFKSGLRLKGLNSSQVSIGKFIYPFGKTPAHATWELAEWGSRQGLQEEDLQIVGNQKVYSTVGKSIKFEKVASQGVTIQMDVFASKEYSTPRQEGQEWPHLLLEQAFLTKHKLKDIKHLVLQLEGQLLDSQLKMKQEEFNPGLHAAQFQLFITIQDLNPQSPKYGDFFWFGIPFYDSRYRDIEVYAAKDIGKDDASGKFIYSLATRDFMDGSFHDGRSIAVHHDLYPHVLKALKIARERGYLKDSKDEDLMLSSMNIGWEVPGTFDVSFIIKNFDLQIVK